MGGSDDVTTPMLRGTAVTPALHHEVMLKELKAQVTVLRELLAAVEPGATRPEDARELLEVAVAIEQLGAGIKLLLAPRALVAAPWQEEGHRSQASWLAEATRSSVPQAVSVLKSGKLLEELPATADALRRGTLSPTEVQIVTSAASADPSAESELLKAASNLPVHHFRLYAKEVARCAHERDPDHHRKLRCQRYLNFWTDVDGQFRFSGALPPEDGMQFASAVRSRAAHVADDVRRAGEPDDRQAAYDADALVSLVRGEQRAATFSGPLGVKPRRNEVVLHVSQPALTRGHLEHGEICEIPGVGPVSVAAARDAVGDAHLTQVITDGVDVTTVTNLGRTVPSAVNIALEARDRKCVVPNCSVTYGLEIDHWQIPFADGGPSALWNLCRICHHHHRMKTYEGYVLIGGPGKWDWRPPD